MVSVIIPIYNAEKYLHLCLDSVLDSAYADFELILVNDGSTDGSLAICEEYKARDSRIRLFSQENRGVSSARNKGISESRGEWLVFIDADDLISPNFLGLIAKKDLQAADLLLFDFAAEKNQLQTGTPTPEKFFYNKGQILPLLQRILVPKQLIKNGNINFLSPCAKAYKKGLIEKHTLRFVSDIHHGEDILFNISYLLRAESCIYLHQPVYFYNLHADSLSKRFTPGLLQEHTELLTRIKNLLETGQVFATLKEPFYTYALYNMTDILVSDIFHPDNRASYPEKREACRRLRGHALYSQAMQYRDICDTPGRRLLALLFRMKQYRAAGLLCRAGFWYLQLRYHRLEAAGKK